MGFLSFFLSFLPDASLNTLLLVVRNEVRLNQSHCELRVAEESKHKDRRAALAAGTLESRSDFGMRRKEICGRDNYVGVRERRRADRDVLSTRKCYKQTLGDIRRKVVVTSLRELFCSRQSANLDGLVVGRIGTF